MFNYPLQQRDLQDLPYPSNCEVYTFVGAVDDDLTSVNWKVWNKPKGSTMVYILAVGAGGGGGRGFGRPNGDPGGGGGGGGSGGVATLLIPSFFLPDILYIRPGSGGEGSNTNGVAGTNGGIAYVCFSQSTTAPNVLLESSSTQAGGGGTGTGAAVGAAGTAAGSTTIYVGSLLGYLTGIVGQAGGAGGNPAGGNGVSLSTVWNGFKNSGGAGGAGSDADPFSGGNIAPGTATNFTFLNWPNAAGGGILAAGGSSTVRNGSSGVNLWAPFVSCGGAGGGTNDDSGGNGGNGGIGSGGGGGGTGDGTVGRGGNGGPGMVFIFSW
jgi:hypothetical protein